MLAVLILLFKVCNISRNRGGLFGFYFLKLFSILKNKENRENMLGSSFFFSPKNIKNTKFKEQKKSLQRTFVVFFVFSTTVLKNSFQKHEPNKP